MQLMPDTGIHHTLHILQNHVYNVEFFCFGSKSEISGKFRNVVLEKISWTDHVRNEEVLLRVIEQRNILHEIRKRKANWIGHILRRNCLLKQVIEGKKKGRWKWQEDEEEDVRSYWMTLRTGEDTLI